MQIIDNPREADPSADIICILSVATTAKGFIGRFFVDYDVLIGNEWMEGRIQIPLAFIDPRAPDLRYVTYPELRPRTADKMIITFQSAVFRASLQSLASGRFKANKLFFNRVVFQLLQTDKNLFNYYNTTHAFRDPQSIRLDEPLFSNISGGFGIVGAYTLDSLVHLLPENFSYNNK